MDFKDKEVWQDVSVETIHSSSSPVTILKGKQRDAIHSSPNRKTINFPIFYIFHSSFIQINTKERKSHNGGKNMIDYGFEVRLMDDGTMSIYSTDETLLLADGIRNISNSLLDRCGYVMDYIQQESYQTDMEGLFNVRVESVDRTTDKKGVPVYRLKYTLMSDYDDKGCTMDIRWNKSEMHLEDLLRYIREDLSEESDDYIKETKKESGEFE